MEYLTYVFSLQQNYPEELEISLNEYSAEGWRFVGSTTLPSGNILVILGREKNNIK